MTEQQKHKKKNIRYALVILTMMVLFVIILILLTFTIEEIKKTKEESITTTKEDDLQFIYSHLMSLQRLSQYQAEEVIRNIEADIKETFDLDELEDALDSDDPTVKAKLYGMIRRDVEDKHLNGIDSSMHSMIVLGKDKRVLVDLFVNPSLRDADKTPSYHSDEYVYFDDYLTSTHNEALFRDALRKIDQRSQELIVIEPYNFLGDEEHTMIDEMTYETFRTIMRDEGLEGFKNYQFLVPAYLTKDGDIFGTDDVVRGEYTHNYKIIVLQTFNLYDQLLNLDTTLTSSDRYQAIEDRYNGLVYTLQVFGIILICTMAGIIVLALLLCNFISVSDRALADTKDD